MPLTPKAGINKNRSVKFVGPFCYLIIAFFVIYKLRRKLIKKVKTIVDAILGD